MTALPEFVRAAVFHRPLDITMERFRPPILNEGDVLARILCATICGSDLHTYYGHRTSPAPSVLGHEMVGEIVTIPSAGLVDMRGVPLFPGDRISWSIVWSCGLCFYCTRDLPAKCERLMKFGHERITPSNTLTGGFADLCWLPAGTAIYKVPRHLPDAVAAPANCATATVACVFRDAGDVRGARIVVIGAGMLGLTACAMAAVIGAASVVAIDIEPHRLQRALDFGAVVGIDGSLPCQELIASVRRVTSGRGADLVLEFSGAPEAIETGWQLLRTGGRMIMVGATFPSRPVEIPADQIVRRVLGISGIHNYRPSDLGDALSFLSDYGCQFPFASLVEETFPLSRIQEAFDFSRNLRPLRVAVRPDTPGTPEAC